MLLGACPALTVFYSRAGRFYFLSFMHLRMHALMKPCLLGPRCNFCRMSASVRLFNFSPMKVVFSFIHPFFALESVGLSIILDTIGRKNFFRRKPIQRTHRAVVGTTLVGASCPSRSSGGMGADWIFQKRLCCVRDRILTKRKRRISVPKNLMRCAVRSSW